MASPNFSHTRCLASDTAAAAALRACRYPAVESGVLQDIISRKASFFNRTASLTTGVHHGVRGLPPLEEPKTLRPQLATAASAMEALNTAHSGSMPPTSTGMPNMQICVLINHTAICILVIMNWFAIRTLFY
ncbi:unnamed protein product [Boreogadus saida]